MRWKQQDYVFLILMLLLAAAFIALSFLNHVRG